MRIQITSIQPDIKEISRNVNNAILIIKFCVLVIFHKIILFMLTYNIFIVFKWIKTNIKHFFSLISNIVHINRQNTNINKSSLGFSIFKSGKGSWKQKVWEQESGILAQHISYSLPQGQTSFLFRKSQTCGVGGGVL